MELQGTIKTINETQTFASGFQKREMVILTQEQYPQPINIEFLQDKCDVLNTYKVGDSIKVGINIRGREWVSPQGDTKYFNSIVGWKVDKISDAPNSGSEPGYGSAPIEDNPFASDDDSDLPF